MLTDHITHAETKSQTQQWISSLRSLQADDIARAVVFAVTQPAHVAINEILVRPTDQAR